MADPHTTPPDQDRRPPETTMVHGVAVVGADAATAGRATHRTSAAAAALFLLLITGFCIADLVSPADHRDVVAQVLETAAGERHGIDAAWLMQSPPPLPRRPVPRSMREQWERVPQLMFLCPVNEVLLRALWQKGRGLEAAVGPDYPREYDVFTVPDGGIAPKFRYPPSVTMPDGLTTNAFGFRGPDLPVDKPPHTIRIACVGASTTVDSHHFAWSYPELMQHWLCTWAAARGLAVRFEVINAGREAITSTDIRAIVRYEVLPLAPDYVVYYEGANQCGLQDLLRNVRVQGAFTAGEPPPSIAVDRTGLAAQAGPVVAAMQRHAVNGNRLLRIAGFGDAAAEPDKPAQTVVLPAQLDELDPDPQRAGEFLQLGTILADLDAIRADCGAAQARLVLCSFCWMVESGVRLDLAEGRSIFEHLNRSCWPLSYASLRRLTDLQNRFFAAWARQHGVPFLDLAAQLPRDERLFLDAVHATELGSRLRAWLTFVGLVGLIERDLAAGALPVPDRQVDAAHPFLPPPRRLTAAELDGR